MAIVCDAESLTDAAITEGFAAIPWRQQAAVITYLLQQTAGNSMTVSELVDASKCYECIPGERAFAAVYAYLLCQIQAGGGGGGGGSSGLVGTVDPEGVITADSGTSYLNTSTGGFWFKASGSGNTGWLQLIA